MKQVIVELEEAEHAALKRRAARNFRKIPQQLLYEALQHAALITGESPPARKPGRKGAVA